MLKKRRVFNAILSSTFEYYKIENIAREKDFFNEFRREIIEICPATIGSFFCLIKILHHIYPF